MGPKEGRCVRFDRWEERRPYSLSSLSYEPHCDCNTKGTHCPIQTHLFYPVGAGLKGGRRNWKRKFCLLKDEKLTFWNAEEDVDDNPHSIVNLSEFGRGVTLSGGGVLNLAFVRR